MALLLDQESKSYKKQHLIKLEVCWIDTYRIVKCEFFLQPVALYLLLNTWERFWRYVKFEKSLKETGTSYGQIFVSLFSLTRNTIGKNIKKIEQNWKKYFLLHKFWLVVWNIHLWGGGIAYEAVSLHMFDISLIFLIFCLSLTHKVTFIQGFSY